MNILAKGTQFLVGDGASPENFTAVTGKLSIEHSGVAWDEEETTNHDNTTPRKEFLQTLAEEGTYTLSLLYDSANAQHTTLKSRANSVTPTIDNYRVTLPGSVETADFAAFVKSFSFDTDVQGRLKASVEVRVTGQRTIT